MMLNFTITTRNDGVWRRNRCVVGVRWGKVKRKKEGVGALRKKERTRREIERDLREKQCMRGHEEQHVEAADVLLFTKRETGGQISAQMWVGG